MRQMSFAQARRIIGAASSGPPFGQTSKMPGFSYGLDAQQCRRGGQLAKVAGTICNAHCYAKRNFYATWGPVIQNRVSHQSSVDHPEWVPAMLRLFTRYLRPNGEPQYFRWLDSGDLPSVEFLAKVAVVADRTPWVRHWLPTRECDIVREYLAAVGGFPPNLVLRISADYVGAPPALPSDLAWLPTSTVHREGERPVQVSVLRKHSVECKSYQRDHRCGPCRACWSPDVKNVSYTLTDGKRGKRSDALRVLT